MLRSPLARSASFALLVLAAGTGTLRADPPERPAGVELYLDVIANDRQTGLIAAFVDKGGGALATTAEELAEIGIRAAPTEIGGDGLVELGQLQGLSYTYDETAQVIRIEVIHNRLIPRAYSADRRRTAPLANDGEPARGVALNYTLYATADGEGSPLGSALADAWWFGPRGTFAQSGLVRSQGAGESAVRLDTVWTMSDPERLTTWRGGDIISGGLAWTRPVRLGGVQIQRNFDLRPDLVTMPLPDFSSSAAVPSTVEVFANGIQLFSDSIPAGPFTISNLPVVSGAGTAHIVMRDALGRSTESNVPFYTSPMLLRRGLSDFSIEAGFPRRGFGVDSADYAGQPAVSTTLRHGLSDRVTVELHGEATHGLANAGAGIVTPVGAFGLLTAAAAASTGERTGIKGHLGLDLSLRFASLHLRTMRAFGDYADIASASALPGTATGAARAIDQVSLAVPFAGRRGSVAIAYASVRTETTNNEVATLTYNQRLGESLNFYASGYASLRDGGSGLFVGLTRSLADGMFVGTQASTRDDVAAGRAEIAKSSRPEPGAISWRVAGGYDGDPNWLAQASLRGNKARYSGTLRGSDNSLAASGEIAGAVVVSGGDVFMSRTIGDSFAIVDAGAPGVTILSENRKAGETNQRGKVLVTGLRSYEPNRLALDLDTVPTSDLPERTNGTVVPAARSGVRLKFGIARADDVALLVIRDRAGAFPAAGTIGRTADGGEFVVGYGGEAYLSGLGPSNRIEVSLPGGACSAEFPFAAGATMQPVIEVACR